MLDARYYADSILIIQDKQTLNNIAINQLSEFEKETAQSLLTAILSHESLAKPVYCPEVQSEGDASTMADILPLVYIWNEDQSRGSFSVSINGSIVGSILEQKVNRSNVSFKRIRDEVMRVLSQATQGAVVSSCESIGAMPSQIFARNEEEKI